MRPYKIVMFLAILILGCVLFAQPIQPVFMWFTDLMDTPEDYTDDAGKIPVVNAGEDALEFTNTPVVTTLTVTDSAVIDANSAVFQPATDDPTFFQVLDADGGTPILNVDSTNERVGVGKAGPSTKLDINGNMIIQGTFEDWHVGLASLQFGGNAGFTGDIAKGVGKGFHVLQNALFDNTNSRWEYISTDEASRYTQANGTHEFYVAGVDTAGNNVTWTPALIIENVGHIGMWTVPENWIAGFAVLQLSGNAGLSADLGKGASKAFNISQNAFFDNTNSRWEYISTDEASRYEQVAGEHRFNVVASGTADAAINWTQAMTIYSTSDVDVLNDFTAGTIQADNGVSGTLVLDDGTTERITLIFTGGVLTSRTVAAASALLMDWTD